MIHGTRFSLGSHASVVVATFRHGICLIQRGTWTISSSIRRNDAATFKKSSTSAEDARNDERCARRSSDFWPNSCLPGELWV